MRLNNFITSLSPSKGGATGGFFFFFFFMTLSLFLTPSGVKAAPGDYNAGDIAVINAMRSANGLDRPAAAANGDVTALWMRENWYGILWSNDATNKRIIYIDISNLTPKLTGTLDVTALPYLTTLYCSQNSLTAINASNLADLGDLFCHNNNISSIDVSGCTALWDLRCTGNSLTSLDISDLTNLMYLRCNDNSLTSLALNAAAPFTMIYVQNNNMTHESKVTGQAVAWGTGNFIYSPQNVPQESVVASGDYNAGDIAVINAMRSANGLTWPAAEANGAVTPEWMATNWPGVAWTTAATDKRITKLEVVSMTPKLSGALNVSTLANMEILWCSGNALTSLKVSGCPNMQQIDAHVNALSGTLDVSECPKMIALWCYSNDLTAVILNASAHYEEINVSQNRMTAESAVTGQTVVWDNDVYYIFYPQKVPVAFEVTVNSGTGSGSYTEGATVAITADAAPAGKVFDRWTSSPAVAFADATGASTSFTMPANAVAITATWKDDATNNESFQPVGLKAYTSNGILYISGLTVGQGFYVYTVNGTPVYRKASLSPSRRSGLHDNAESRHSLTLPARGIYIVTDGATTVKVVN